MSFDTHEPTKQDLDLQNNDNSFHVLAQLLVDFFEARKIEKKIILKPSDKNSLDRLLPESARVGFIRAVQFRLERVPRRPTTSLQFLTIKCQELGLHSERISLNPILAFMQMKDEAIVVPVVSAHADGNRDAADPSTVEDSIIGRIKSASLEKADTYNSTFENGSFIHNQSSSHGLIAMVERTVTAAHAVVSGRTSTDPPQRNGTIDNTGEQRPSSAFSSVSQSSDRVEKTCLSDEELGKLEAQKQKIAKLASGSFESASAYDPSSTDNLLHKQLLTELREATILMKDSVTAETAEFWKKHVSDLRARLRSLQIESPVPLVQGEEHTSRRSQNATISNPRSRNTPTMNHPKGYIPPHVAQSPSESESKKPTVHSRSVASPAEALSAPDYDTPMVDVISPADLPGGYHFEAEIEGQRFLATVPAGGVQQGETFTCYMRALNSVAIDIPVGYWKDNMTDICTHGCCHPVVWSSSICPLLPLSQIQHRLGLDFLGRPKIGEPALSTRTMMLTVTAFWVVINLGLFSGFNIKWSHGMELSIADWAALALLNGAFVGFTIFATQSTRNSLRDRFLIREQCCNDLEDICYSTWCLCCTVAQMSRHTANYDDYEAVCCSKSGLPDGVRVNRQQHSSKYGNDEVV